MKKNLLYVSFLLFLSIALSLFLGNNRESERHVFSKGDSYIEGLKIVHKKNGISVWSLNAKKADIMEGEGKAKLSDIAMILEDKGMTIHAATGLYDLSSRNLSLDSRITAVAKDYTITADSAEWDQSKGEIKTNGAVRVESRKFEVEGSGMEADSGQKVRILKNEVYRG